MSHHSDEHQHLGHVLPFKTYVIVLISLFVLTAITVAVGEHDFGELNLIVAMGIASIKATLVALFFMHLKYESPITWVFALIPIFFLLILIGGIYIDNPFRVMP